MSLTIDQAVAIAMPYAQEHWCWDDELFIREQLEVEMPLANKHEVETAIDAIAADFDLAPASFWRQP